MVEIIDGALNAIPIIIGVIFIIGLFILVYSKLKQKIEGKIGTRKYTKEINLRD